MPISRASRAGSPRSQPSETSSTIAPLRMVRRTHRRLSWWRHLADPGAAAPVHHLLRHAAERRVGAPGPELARDPRQARSEHEHLERRAAPLERMGEAKHEPAVALHAAADIAHQDDRPGPLGAAQPAPPERLAAGTQRVPEHRSGGGPVAAPRDPASPRAAHGEPGSERLDHRHGHRAPRRQ